VEYNTSSRITVVNKTPRITILFTAPLSRRIGLTSPLP
jgi:hypothetical protein